MLMSALADRTRLRLLNLMARRELCVCYLVEVLGQNQPKISRHLACLRRTGIVRVRRDGKWMHYRIIMPADLDAANVLKAVLGSFNRDKEMQYDLQRLTRACCQPQKFVTLAGAPVPAIVKSTSVA